ncbi:glycosyltransferase family 1 protein [Clostridium sp. 19966]|uniref:glycosyltransferase family 4 protein n=1 Tax=Clostridium sp. 19966 TaxID=2768166 RepID=UPI0028DE3F70|nr:glycosyltransferase family 1 protein [Clostridium sp. 19966]MDT8718169.1 glycosyltransferase family 1 protein [Clostridium sp. 19966]
MKVAVFTDTFLPQVNGVTNTLKHLIKYFENKKIDYLIFAPDSYVECDDKFKVEKFLSIKFFIYPECRLAFPNLIRLKNSLIKFKADIIFNVTEFNMGMLGLYLGKKFDIPVISNYTTNFSQYLKYYNLSFLENNFWNYLKWFHTKHDLTLCPSKETRNLLKKQGIENVNIFSRGIDTENFTPSLRSESLRKSLQINNKIVLLYVGRISPEKDINILHEAYLKLLEKYPSKLALIITGDGPELLKYKKLFPPDTIFTGYKTGPSLSETYASSDIFAFPSPTETFGNVVLEALASGLPVAAPNAGGIKDIIKNEFNGLLFEAGNSKEFSDAIANIINNEFIRDRIIANGRKTALDRSWESIFDSLIYSYEKTIFNKSQKIELIS